METPQVISAKMKKAAKGYYISMTLLFIAVGLMLSLIFFTPTSEKIMGAFVLGALVFLFAAIAVFLRTTIKLDRLQGMLDILVPRELVQKVSKQ